MTAYTAFKALGDGLISLDDEVRVSKKAWGTEGSRTFIQAGTTASVEDLLQGMIVQSGNDASVALAEHVAGPAPAPSGAQYHSGAPRRRLRRTRRYARASQWRRAGSLCRRKRRVREPVRSEQLLQHTGVDEGLQRRIERAAVNDHVSLERMFGDRVFNGRPCGVEAGPEAPLQSDLR